MGLANKNLLYESSFVGLAVAPQSIASAATVNGATIAAPWLKGRNISFIILGGAMGATTSLQVKVQQQKISDSSWVNMTRKDAATVLEFPAADLDDAQALEGGALLGTLDCSDIDGTTYKAIRLVVIENGGGANTVLFGAAYVITDPYSHPTGQVDKLHLLQRYAP